ncbi:MAG: excinuclease ABC subunit UvrC [Verrucomicrobia bacterium]|nr:MAG: excinuclease ABC subunit UvrC [Verrucomicrobiota bacterium]TAE87397.1 MAG: excinuclease ABC subunit UvrC [Verrucomicrobiota bacterium]TAF25251.1 MAG: excinuclease ABC subunit UvrC [Verrucomicrobiota bacterium]TAF40846.1 MAG: excinuclease ABC subunit UvrC [Verrucomicrobiota bacterium]
MKDRLGSIIYVGKARDLRKRMSSYFLASRKTRADLKTRALIDSIADFEFHTVRNEAESLLLEGKLIKDYRPRYNVAFRDDKRFLLVKIQPSEPWPRFVLTRMRKEDGARYFGPFAHSGALRATISWLNRGFGLRACRPLNPGDNDYKHCNADIIRNCAAPCMLRITREAYLERIEEACRVLEGKGRREIFTDLEQEMTAAAARLDFEKAALLRDVVDNLRKTLNPTRQFTRGRGVPTTVKPTEDLADLGEALGLPGPPRVMECFDISNVSSNHIVASMVRFTAGAPDNQNYRRYRIRTVEGQDDFASMAEVIRRRYSRILVENLAANPELAESQEDPVEIQRRLAKDGRAKIVLPDLVIVDGGKGQLSSALRELRQLGLHELPVIGLAKQREEVFFPGESEPLLIPHDRGALKLLQRIRDEAHRFANGYNALLYRRRMKESLLDDCPAISPKKKQALLAKFGSVERIRKAGVEEIAALPGISQKSAEAILEWLG